MRSGLFLFLPLCFIACKATPQAMARAPVRVAQAQPAPAAPRLEQRSGDEAITMAVLRTHLLQLLPCTPSSSSPSGPSGEVEVGVTQGPGGVLLGLRLLAGDLPAAAARCVLSRVAWWDLSPSPSAQGEGERIFRFSFPLLPPSINDHVAVLVPGGGRVSLAETTRELRRLRPRVLSCLAPAPALPPSRSPRLVLFSLHLGEWGKLLHFGLEADPTQPQAAPGRSQRERACLRRALRQARFPNPKGEVDVRFPYVVLP